MAAQDAVDSDDQQEARERERPKTIVIFEAIRAEGEDELERSVASLAWSGLAAGASMVLALLAMGSFAAFTPPGALWRPLAIGLGYPLGYLIVILGRQQLFTENTLTPILPLLAAPNRRTLWLVARLWAIVLAANVVGALAASGLLALAHPFPAAAAEPMAAFGVEMMHGDLFVRFGQGIFAGWLIALMVWLLPLAESAGPFIIFAVTYVVGISQLSHIIAGSVEFFYSAWVGRLEWGAYPSFFVPTVLGNIIGGVAFVALIGFAQIASDRPASRKRTSQRAKNDG